MFSTKPIALAAALAGACVAGPAWAGSTSSVPTGTSVGTTNPQIVCLGDALQYEARHTVAGNASVAAIIFARVDSGEYGRTVCDTVYAYRKHTRNGYTVRYYHGRNPGKGAVSQFSFANEGKPWPWRNGAAHRKLWFGQTLPLAKRLYADWQRGTATVAPAVQRQVSGCDSFHATSAKSVSRHRRKANCGIIEGHLFYASNGVKKRPAPTVDDIITASTKVKPLPPVQIPAEELASNR